MNVWLRIFSALGGVMVGVVLSPAPGNAFQAGEAMSGGQSETSRSTAATPEPARPQVAHQEALRLIDAWLEGQRAFDQVPGLSAGIVAGDQLVWAKGYGTIDANGTVEANSRTIYSICSISKVFTSIALMQQFEQGRVRLDEPIETYLPWAALRPIDPLSAPATIRTVLSHSSGLPREADFQYWAAPDFNFPTREAIRERIASQQMLYGTSRHYQYSNLGIVLVGEVVQAVTGERLADNLQRNLFAPLGMNDTGPFASGQRGGRVAVGYGAIERDGRRTRLGGFEPRGLLPAAGFASTVEDLASFARWQFRLLRTGSTEILRSSTLREMQRVQFMDPDWRTTRGLGFGVYRNDGETYVGHSGECPGYFTNIMMHLPTERAVIVMMNAAQPTGPYVRGVFSILNKRNGFSFKAPAPFADINLEEFSGRYSEQPWGSEAVIVPWAGGLAYLSVPSANPGADIMLLKPVGPDLFRRVRDDGTDAEEVRFERNQQGSVVRMIHHNNPSRRLSQ